MSKMCITSLLRKPSPSLQVKKERLEAPLANFSVDRCTSLRASHDNPIHMVSSSYVSYGTHPSSSYREDSSHASKTALTDITNFLDAASEPNHANAEYIHVDALATKDLEAAAVLISFSRPPTTEVDLSFSPRGSSPLPCVQPALLQETSRSTQPPRYDQSVSSYSGVDRVLQPGLELLNEPEKRIYAMDVDSEGPFCPSKPTMVKSEDVDACSALSAGRTNLPICAHPELEDATSMTFDKPPIDLCKEEPVEPVLAQTAKQGKAAEQFLTRAHISELAEIWSRKLMVPTVKSRRAWAKARNAPVRRVSAWFCATKARARKAGKRISDELYELEFGSPPPYEEPQVQQRKSTSKKPKKAKTEELPSTSPPPDLLPGEASSPPSSAIGMPTTPRDTLSSPPPMQVASPSRDEPEGNILDLDDYVDPSTGLLSHTISFDFMNGIPGLNSKCNEDEDATFECSDLMPELLTPTTSEILQPKPLLCSSITSFLGTWGQDCKETEILYPNSAETINLQIPSYTNICAYCSIEEGKTITVFFVHQSAADQVNCRQRKRHVSSTFPPPRS